MGAYLSEPVTEKVSSDEVNDILDCAASSMQGWRVNQEVLQCFVHHFYFIIHKYRYLILFTGLGICHYNLLNCKIIFMYSYMATYQYIDCIYLHFSYSFVQTL